MQRPPSRATVGTDMSWQSMVEVRSLDGSFTSAPPRDRSR